MRSRQLSASSVPDLPYELDRMTSSNSHSTTIFLLLTLVVALGFGTYLALNRVTDPFLYYDVAFVQESQGAERMSVPDDGPFASLAYVPGREMLMLQLANMTALDPRVLQYLPVGAVVVSLTCFLAAHRLLSSPALAFLVTTYLTLNLSHATALYSVFAYALALPLFLAFVVVALRYSCRRSARQALLLVLLFTGLHLIHYTLATWAAIFLGGLNIAIWWQRKHSLRLGQFRPLHSVYLSLAAGVIFLGFNETFYDSFLPLAGPDRLRSAIERLFLLLSLDAERTRSPYLFSRPAALGIVSSLSLIVILTPIVAGIVHEGVRLRAGQPGRWLKQRDAAVVLAIGSIGLIDCASYAMRGSVSTKAFSLLFPFLALLYLSRLRRAWFAYLIAGILVLTSVVKIGAFHFASYVIGDEVTGTGVERVEQSANWLADHAPRDNYAMLADLQLYGKHLINTPAGAPRPIAIGFDEDHYAHLAGMTSVDPAPSPDIVAIDQRSSQPTVGFLFLVFEPLREHLDAIRDNGYLNVIYDDGAILLGRPTERE